MNLPNRSLQHLLASFGLVVLIVALPLAARQEDSEKYRLDYEKAQKIAAVSDPLRRADQMFAFLKEKPDPKIDDYAQGIYFQVLDGLLKAENYQSLLTLSERYVKFRPRVPEIYYFYGAALRHTDRFQEAYAALAKCSVVRNPASAKARSFLEFIYKQKNNGSLVGLDKIIKQAQADMGK